MKKLVFISMLSLLTAAAFGQTLQKGNVVGFHNGTFIPNPDVTMNQCVNFFVTKYIPAVEKNFPGMKGYILKGKRGDCVDCIGFLMVFPNDDVRNKYWKGESGYTEAGNAANEKMKPVEDEMAKFGKMTDKFTDWVVL